MINEKKFFPLYVLFMGLTVIKLDAAAQSRHWIPAKPASTAWVATSPTRSAVTPQGNIGPEKVKESVIEALAIIEKNHINGKNLNYADVFKWSITAALHTLDPYSTYYDAKGFAELKTNPPRADIGIIIQDHLIEGERGVFIHAALQGSAAVRSGGLKFGDKIIRIDDWNAKSHSLADVNEKLRGPRGSKFKITIERTVDGELQTIEVIRESFPQPAVPHAYMLEAGVGYIDLGKGFKQDTANTFDDKLQELHNKGMTSLVLDLRNNAGGLLMQCISVANQFLAEGQLIVTIRGTRKTKFSSGEYRAINRNPDKSPIVVLVNERTGSAPEIVSGALQDHKRALIVGETTFGHGLIQFPFTLEYGSALLLTTSRFVLPLGRLVQGDYSSLSFYYEIPPRRIENSVSVSRGGIEPDEVVRRVKISSEQRQIIDPVFGFARQLVNGRINDFNSYEVRQPVNFSHDFKPDEFVVTDSLFNAFKEFVAKQPGYKLTEKQLDNNRQFIARQLRYNIVAAFYGLDIAERILKADDPQILRAVEALPRAARLVTQ